MSKLTPMMRQYQEIKAEHPGTILFFRLGDFYEMFGQDAIEASKILDITLTARNKKTEPIPMCGVPHHSAENYIAKLTRAGRKVALCEQVSDPTLPGIVKRKVVRIVTPGTTFNRQILDGKANRYLLSIFPQKDYFGIAFADLTTGEFQAAEFQGVEELKSELLRLQPAEIVLHQTHYDDPEWRPFFLQLTEVPLSPCELYEEPARLLRQTFKVTTLEGFGVANWPFAIQAAGLLMRYLMDTQQAAVAHIQKITAYHRDQWMPLDEASLRNLELFNSLHGGQKEGTLLSILDSTQTAMGGRQLRRWLAQPLLDIKAIGRRHAAVDNLTQNDELRHALTEQLEPMRDLERLLARLSTQTGNARDLLGLAHSLAAIPQLQDTLNTAEATLLVELKTQLHALEHLVETVQSGLLDQPSLKLNDGGMIRPGHHAGLDELHGLMKDAKTALKNIEQQEIKRTGINSMKVKFNKVFGYYLEVSKANLDKVPEDYIRKQTLVNAERFITPELKEYEEKVLGAEEKAKALEYELFLELRELALQHIRDIQRNARALAQLDVLTTFARTAIDRRYTRPELVRDRLCHIENGRHPVVENMSFERRFIPNDTHFTEDDTELKLITGPNMSGKSTYLRQVALIALMSQIGSFVPASRAVLPVFDRIFTRVGASDNLVRGQSTFMVEMQESAFILNHATERSLIILDEVGRGTSTYDGLSLAWAIFEHLHQNIRGFTLFATHYHELIQLANELPRAKNYSIDVQETAKGVLFLHKIKEGSIDKSYGIEVAKLAGLPQPLIERAQALLTELEQEHELHPAQLPQNQMDLFARTYESSREPGKLTHPALEQLKSVDIEQLTPLQALNMLDELKNLE